MMSQNQKTSSRSCHISDDGEAKEFTNRDHTMKAIASIDSKEDAVSSSGSVKRKTESDEYDEGNDSSASSNCLQPAIALPKRERRKHRRRRYKAHTITISSAAQSLPL